MPDGTVKFTGIARFDSPQPDRPDEPVALRRVVQIASASEMNPVVALCSDSSIWVLNKASATWSRLPDVPLE